MYITYDVVVLTYPVLAKWAVDSTTVSSRHIPYAEAELNSRLAAEYTVPFSDAPLMIKDLSTDLVYLRFLRTRGDKKVIREFKKCLDDRISRIIDGDDLIYTDSGTVIGPGGSGQEIWSSNEDYKPTFDMHDAEDQRIDCNRLSDEAAERPNCAAGSSATSSGA